MTQARFIVDGMHCGSCTGTVERTLLAQPGVSEASANLMAHSAQVSFTAPATPAALAKALADAGYPVSAAHLRLDVTGMSCASCVSHVEEALLATPGVLDATVNLATGSADVRYAQGSVAPSELVKAVEATGYGASVASADAPPPPLAERQAEEAHRLRRNVVLSVALTLPVFVLAMGGHMVPAFHHWMMHSLGERTVWGIEFVLTALVLAFPGRMFLTIGIPALLRGKPEMNSLVALGALAAFLYSTVVTLAPDLLPEADREVYFEAAAVIVTLILVGRWLEARAKGRAGEAISRLVALRPATARVRRGETAVELPVAELAPGDVVELAPGERIAVDGVVIEGEGHVDESMLTGEPLPAAKAPGAAITGGTVNGAAALAFRVTATGGDTVLARIIGLVEEAQGQKLPVQALVDKVTRIFVPTVMALSVLTFGLWLLAGQGFTPALIAAISVMIIACPCAMGLATPVSILVGTGRAAELGLLFRRGDALQRLAEVRTIAFDKTGTLTEGRPELVTLIPVPGASEAEALALAAGAEARSEHPLARAIVRAAEAKGIAPLPARRVRAEAGRGLHAEVGGAPVVLGNARAMEEAGIDISALRAEAEAEAREGRTPVYLARSGALVALMAIADPVKPGAAETVKAIRALGAEAAMTSGDPQTTAEAAARGLGIGKVIAGVLPEGKVEAITALKAEGSVAFVGDGINDAPALAAADVGLAIGSGTDVAIEAAEVVLMGADPEGAVRALRISRAVMRNIRENLFWAFAYNAALIPVAMGVLRPFGGPGLSPMLAAGAMAFSSVFVVTNALRLRRVK
ncbi:heavy metal translocating P-type ATPase [Paenirhodobacter enshiensis]|uniref:heavy metal translocating P-type ATPase n=1 Tax=Paenirhodobacter enshiensis TaxID=1105367 RepID=UPI003FA1EF34